MKIIKLSAKVSKISNEDIKRELQAIPSPERTLALLNEASNRKYIEAFYIASASPDNINNLPILKQIASMIVANPKSPATLAITDNILEFAKNIDPSVINKINSIAISNPAIASTVLLHHNTPDNFIDSIIGHLHLNITTMALLDSNQFLQAIIDDLKKGESWNNERSGLIMTSRIVQFPRDPFINEVSKYNLTPSVAGALINASRLYKAQNAELDKNLQANTSAGVEIAKLVYDEGIERVAPNAIIPGLIVSIEKTKYQPYVQWIWNLIKKKMSEKPEWELQTFNSHYDGKNIIVSILEMIPTILPDLIDIIKSSKNLGAIKNKPVYEEIIHLGLSNPTYRTKTLELPEEYFQMIKMTKENQQIVEDHFHPKIEGHENLEELMGRKNDWYIKYALSEELLKEAGWKENIITSLLAAILTVLGGSTIHNAAKRHNIKEEDLQKALENKELVTRAKQVQDNESLFPSNFNELEIEKINNPSENIMTESPLEEIKNLQDLKQIENQTDIDDVVKIIMKHEGLLPKQTPFRITSPEMRKWNNIQGFKIDKTTPKPSGRENFIFLSNPDDVPKAIKKQLSNYASNPSRYGLSSSPTLKEALYVFDQSGAQNKINFMLKNLPSLNLLQPLAELFT